MPPTASQNLPAATIAAAICAVALLASASAQAQQTAAIDFQSVGRGAPLVSIIPSTTPADRTRLEAYPDNDRVVGP